MTEEDYKLLGEFLQRAGAAYIEDGKVKWVIKQVKN